MHPKDYENSQRMPPDVPIPGFQRGGPVQINLEGLKGAEHGFLWKILSAVAASLITMAIGFIGGATWSHNTRITALETYRLGDKENQDKLEKRVDKLETRISTRGSP